MAGNPTVSTEATPLLVEQDEDTTPRSRYRFQAQRPRTIALLLALLIAILSAATSMMIVPMTRILEDVICHRHYDPQGQGGSIDERICKINVIQSELAYLNGLVSVVEAIVGLFVAFPFGILADRIGRKPVFFLCMLGSTLKISWQYMILFFWHTMPVRLVLLAPIFLVIGGGYTVIVAVIYSIVADVESDTNRASAFFIMSFGFLFGSLLGPTIASRLMETGSPWTPLVIAYTLIPLGISLMVFIPETLQSKRDADEDASQGEHTSASTIKTQLKEALTHSTKYFSMLKSASVVLILITYLIHFPIIVARGQFFVQYFSKRFGWKLSQTGYFLSLRGFISIFVLLVALPGLSTLLLSPSFPFRWTASRKDLTLARLSLFSITIGSVLLAGPNVPMVVSGIVVTTLGDGLSPLCRSLATSFVDSRHTSSLYVLIGISETVGLMFAGPTLAWLFEIGMSLDGLWLGMPYIWLASISALVAVGLCFVRLPAGSVKLSEIDSIDVASESGLVDGNEAEI